MARDRATPSFSVETRNGRQRSPLKRGWADGATPRLTKKSLGVDGSPSGERETTAQSAFRAALANPWEKAAEPSVRSEVRVLPDLSRTFENISSSLERPDPDVPAKQKLAYRRKGQREEHLLREIVEEIAHPQETGVDREDHPDLSDPQFSDRAGPEAEPAAAPMTLTVKMPIGLRAGDGHKLRPGERWKRRLSKYSR